MSIRKKGRRTDQDRNQPSGRKRWKASILGKLKEILKTDPTSQQSPSGASCRKWNVMWKELGRLVSSFLY